MAVVARRAGEDVSWKHETADNAPIQQGNNAPASGKGVAHALDEYSGYDPSQYAITPEGPGSSWTFSTPFGTSYDTSSGFDQSVVYGGSSYSPFSGQYGLDFGLGSRGFSPYETSLSVGPSFRGFSAQTSVFGVPYGYQNAYQGLQNAAYPALGPAFDYGNWMNYGDPFGYSLYGY